MNNRIPPPIYLIVAGALMWLVSNSGYDIRFAVPFADLLASVVIAAGALTAVVAVLQFRQARTTIDPLNPAKASSLVATGMFGFSRNPMYLGMAIILLGAAIRLGSILALMILALFVLVITQVQIKPEEKALSTLFGEQYAEYCRRVRRWI